MNFVVTFATLDRQTLIDLLSVLSQKICLITYSEKKMDIVLAEIALLFVCIGV